MRVDICEQSLILDAFCKIDIKDIHKDVFKVVLDVVLNDVLVTVLDLISCLLIYFQLLAYQ